MCTNYFFMNYELIKDVLDLVEKFEMSNETKPLYSNDIGGFKEWMREEIVEHKCTEELSWEGKEHGRSADSVISTLLVHMSRYAKSYSKSIISSSEISTQDDFIYLITLRVFGPISKIDLIKKNVHDKSVGIQIINRLISQGWVEQTSSEEDKRNKILRITESGLSTLEYHMGDIRKASKVVTGNLTYSEKIELIRLLKKLSDFHYSVYCEGLPSELLLTEAYRKILNN